jgi:hypothetical protein
LFKYPVNSLLAAGFLQAKVGKSLIGKDLSRSLPVGQRFSDRNGKIFLSLLHGQAAMVV